MNSGKIIIVDDDKKIADDYAFFLEQENYKIKIAHNSSMFFVIFKDFYPDVILLDIDLKGSEFNGIEILEKLAKKNHFPKVIVLSGKASRDQVAKAMKLGAFNFIDKLNLDINKLIFDIRVAVESSKQDAEIRKIKSSHIDSLLVGNSPKIMRIKEVIEKVSKHDVSVLITGETGTGKDVVANLIHQNSLRSKNKLVSINIAAIPDSLFESQLFGHKRGSFTGANSDHKGFFSHADKSSLFFDEIGDIALELQAKLLRVLQDKKINPIGENQPIDVDVRMIFATNKDLHKLIEENKFKEDLYHRLGTIINLPKLIDRGADITLLMENFLIKEAGRKGNKLNINLKDILAELLTYNWPGNVREVITFCEKVSIWHDVIDNNVIIDELNDWKLGRYRKKEATADKLFRIKNYKQAVETFESEYLQGFLTKHNWNVDQVSSIIGLDRSSIYKKIKKLNIRKD
jgi:DNA-binding NtrC family response regulator